MVNLGCVDGSLDVYVVVNYVEDYLQCGGDDL